MMTKLARLSLVLIKDFALAHRLPFDPSTHSAALSLLVALTPHLGIILKLSPSYTSFVTSIPPPPTSTLSVVTLSCLLVWQVSSMS